MSSGAKNLSALRVDIIAEAKVFLRGVESGASNAQLIAVVQRIRQKEHELLSREGVVIDPAVWRILHNRLLKRNLVFVDPNA